MAARPPKELTLSFEADLYPRTYPQTGPLIVSTLGRDSRFFRKYGYYADCVTPELATFPDGWEGRLIPFQTENTGGVTAWCVEIHDVAISKLVARREKDFTYVRALLNHKLVRVKLLEERLADTPIDEERKAALRNYIRKLRRGR